MVDKPPNPDLMYVFVELYLEMEWAREAAVLLAVASCRDEPDPELIARVTEVMQSYVGGPHDRDTVRRAAKEVEQILR